MLAIKNLSFYHKKDLRPLLRDFSFSLSPNQRKVALIGEEGNGKSTLLKAILSPKLISDYIEWTGEIDSKDEIIGYLPQTIGTDWGQLSAQELLTQAFPADSFDYNLYYQSLGRLHLSPDMIENNSQARHFSGGEKIKFSLLLALLKKPTLLLLDEPTNDLDLTSVALMEKFIQTSDTPILFVSHDETLLARCADTIILLEQLRHKTKAVHTVANLGYDDFMKQREAGFLRQMKLAAKEQGEFDAKMARYRRVYERVQHELRTVSRQDPSTAKNLKDKMHTVKSMGRRLSRERENLTPKPDGENAIDLKFDERISIPNGKDIVEIHIPILQAGQKILSQNIHLHIRGPEKICIMGPNGAGKTTLLRQMMKSLTDINISCGYMPQVYDEEQNHEVSPVAFLTKDCSKEEHTRIRTYLGSLKFTKEEMLRPISHLSGGQKAKLYFAKMIFDGCQFLILDEPTRNLSPLSGPEIRQALGQFQGGILCVSHDRAFVSSVFEKVYFLSERGLEKKDLESF